MPKHRASVKGLHKRLESQGATAVEERHPIDSFTGADRDVIRVPLEAITPNPGQPRKHFNEARLEELAESIRKQGLLQPVIVKQIDDDRYLLVAGERRFRASKLAGLRKIPALVTSGDELEISIIENLQREDLNPLEEAEALNDLASKRGYTQDALATVVGKSRMAVNETLKLLNLPDPVKHECRTSDVASKSLLLQVVRADGVEKQLALWEAIKSGSLTVRSARGVRKEGAVRGRPRHASRTFKTQSPPGTVTVRLANPQATENDFTQALSEAWSQTQEATPGKSRSKKGPGK